LDELTSDVEERLDTMAGRNLIRKDVDADPVTYTILSEEDIRFWQEVQQEAEELPPHQVQENIQQFIREADEDQLTPDNTAQTGTFGDVEDIQYTVRYSVDQSISDSVTDQYDTIVVRVLAHEESTLRSQRQAWQEQHSGPNGREEVLVTVELTETIRRQVRQLLGMQSVLQGMANPRPDYRLQRQTMQEDLEDELRDRLHEAKVYNPRRDASYGTYLETLDEAFADAVDEKFPDRKTIERSIQHDDLEDLTDFFQDDGSWPLTDADAETLGVKQMVHTIGDGWATEFLNLDRFADEDRVSGEEILETINGRSGEFLGTPRNALHALLFVLVADNRIAIREDGERLTDSKEIARAITNATQFPDAVVAFDPAPPPEDLADVYAALVGDAPETDDTKAVLADLEDWADQHTTQFKTVVSRTGLVFSESNSLDALADALDPAFTGGDLDPDHLTNPTVVDQADLYGRAEALFIPEDEEEDPLWDWFEAVYQQLTDCYPTAEIAKQMSVSANGSHIPDASTLESQIEDALSHRIKTLQTLYQQLTGESTSTDDLPTLREQLTTALTQDTVVDDIDTVSTTYESVDLSALEELRTAAEDADESLSEAQLAADDVQDAIESVANGRALLETTVDEETLYEQLRAVETELEESDTGFVASQIRSAVTGNSIPDADRGMSLLEQGRRILSDDGPDDDDEESSPLEQLWASVEAHDDGTIVVIESEVEQ
jgi:hypothetical protein